MYLPDCNKSKSIFLLQIFLSRTSSLIVCYINLLNILIILVFIISQCLAFFFVTCQLLLLDRVLSLIFVRVQVLVLVLAAGTGCIIRETWTLIGNSQLFRQVNTMFQNVFIFMLLKRYCNIQYHSKNKFYRLAILSILT